MESVDIKAAFLQGRNISREIYVRPPREFAESGIIWKLKKVVYGLNDAARNWYISVTEELLKHGCKQSILDAALFRSYDKNGKLIGLLLMHVDDFLFSGTSEYIYQYRCVVISFKIPPQGASDVFTIAFLHKI